jgi:hypothetical protein
VATATKSGLQERLRPKAHRIVVIAAGITTLIGALLAAKSLVTAFWPQGSVAVDHSAVLSVDRPEIDVTWGQFLRRYPDEVARDGYSAQQLATYGAVFPVELTVTGLAGKTSTLNWTVTNPNGKAGDFDPPAWVPKTRELRPPSSPAHIVAHVWLPPTRGLDAEVVQFVFRDDRGAEVEQTLSRPLQIEP